MENPRPLSIKLLHPSTSPRQPLPLGMLVPTSTAPALLIVMPTTGKVTYWECLSSAASFDYLRQKQQSVEGTISGMLSGENVVKIIEAEPRGFVLLFSTGRLAHMVVNDPQGKPSINVQFLRDKGAQSGSVFGSLKGVFGSAAWRKDVVAVRAAGSSQRGQRYIVIVTSKGSFQIWDFNWNGTHTLIYDIDARKDFLKALTEGADVFPDREVHQCEVLDITILPSGSTGKEVGKMRENGACKLMTLTVLKGQDFPTFTLVGLTLSNGSVTIDVVHPISCYKASISRDTEFRPQVLVPEPAQTAFVIFEKSIVLVSLVEIEETPSSQLQMEANTLPDPFQDAIDFRKTKPYRSVGCASEVNDRGHTQSSCILMIYGFGLIRIITLPMKEGQSALDRGTVTAKMKIEQAVFFGHLQQDLLDFTPRPEIIFTHEEIESAALSVSHSIMSSSSPYVPALGPSMDQQLQKRSTALADLNQHLRQHYAPLSRLTKWRLLWNAEKMAAAKAIWRCYNAAVLKQSRNPEERNILADLIESLHETLKTENQPERHETDGVRHWFIHDVWRLEYILPWAQNMIELLYKESVEDGQELDQATQATYVSEANDIQLTGLETAFEFRAANAASYGLQDESMIDGVLLRGYEDLPDIWTSTADILSSVKNLTDLSRELTYLNADVEGNPGEPSPELIIKLASDNPRQVQICCQTYIERFRWLQSRPNQEHKAAGEELMRSHFEVRKILFASLSDVAQPEEGIRLAEKYRDMDALVAIIDQEMESAESEEVIPLLEERIHSYFIKFGTIWANAFFTKHLVGRRAIDVLDNNAHFKQHLTDFLRRYPTYAKLGWINEISSEQNYAAAADNLQLVQKQETSVWNRKIALSMRKLAIIAAGAKGKVNEKSAKAAILEVDDTVAVLAVQGRLSHYVKSAIGDALDAQAEVDLAMQRYAANFVKDKPTVRKRLEQDLSRLIANQTLPVDNLIDVLTLLDDEKLYPDDEGFMDARFLSALRVLSLDASRGTESGRTELLEKIIWRRCLIQDDWGAINRTELKDDTQVEVETGITSLFKTLKEGYRIGFWNKRSPLPPKAVLEAGTTVASLQASSFLTNNSEHVLTSLARDLTKESGLLEEYMEKGRLEEWWKGVVEAAGTSAREEADRKGEDILRRRQAEQEFELKLTEKDREAFGKVGVGYEGAEMDEQGDVFMGM